MTACPTATPPAYTPDRAAYAAAVETLLGFTDRHRGTGGARAAAQVLLSCYNGFDYHLDPNAIRGLSADAHRFAALTVIVQRVLRPEEPHQVAAEGDRRFRVLWRRYEDELQVGHRYAGWYR